MTPTPPMLFIRPGHSFWVRNQPLGTCSATLQSFEEGCFHNACCYDVAGHFWPVVDAALTIPVSLARHMPPWRQMPVRLHLGAPRHIPLEEVVALLAEVLQGESAFNDFLGRPPAEVLARLKSARTPLDVIRIAGEV